MASVEASLGAVTAIYTDVETKLLVLNCWVGYVLELSVLAIEVSDIFCP